MDRFSRNPLLTEVRYKDLRGRSLADHLDNPRFVEDIGLPAGAGFALDTANPDVGGLEAALKLCDRVLAMRRSSITCRGFRSRTPTAVGLGVSCGVSPPSPKRPASCLPCCSSGADRCL